MQRPVTDLKKEVPLMVKIHWARRIFKMILLAESISG
jgi:hypothetical protein